jgi:hypothetical protein
METSLRQWETLLKFAKANFVDQGEHSSWRRGSDCQARHSKALQRAYHFLRNLKRPPVFTSRRDARSGDVAANP